MGKPVAEATAELKNDGLNTSVVDQISTDAPGTVISTDPSPGTLVKKGDTITLHKAVVAPAAKVQVPAGITNTSLSEAEATLRGVGLAYTVVNRTNNATKGTVLSTNPTSGTTVKVGSSVTLTVSAGPADVQVPSVIGQTQLEAGTLLGNDGLNAVDRDTPVVDAVRSRIGHLVDTRPGRLGAAGQLGHHRGLHRAAADDHDDTTADDHEPEHHHPEQYDHHQPGGRGQQPVRPGVGPRSGRSLSAGRKGLRPRSSRAGSARWGSGATRGGTGRPPRPAPGVGGP